MKATEHNRIKYLRATYDFLHKLYWEQESAIGVTVFYDGTDCDGICLLNDIANELGLPDSDTLFVCPPGDPELEKLIAAK